MNQTRVIITGGSGFIGSNIAKKCLEDGFDVGIIDIKKPDSDLAIDVEYFNTDIRNRSGLEVAFNEFKPDVCIHCAAQISIQKSLESPEYDADVNVLGSINVAELSKKYCNLGLIFSSSGGGIYGNVPTGKADINYETKPTNPYAQHKLVFERVLLSDSFSSMNSVILRYSNVYGKGQKPESEAGVVSIFIDRIKSDKPVKIFGKNTSMDFGCVRDYIHVSDIVKANMWGIQELKESKKTQIINCCTGIGTNTAELASIIYKHLGKFPHFEFEPPRKGDVERSVLDETEFCAKISKPKDLEEGISQTT